MIEELRKNIDSEIEILREIAKYMKLLESASPHEKKMLSESISSLESTLRMVNSSIPEILSNISAAKRLNEKGEVIPLEKVSYIKGGQELSFVINVRDKDRFLKELSISEELVKKLKRARGKKEELKQEYKGTRGYLKLSNKFFLSFTRDLVEKGNFKSLSLEIKKANLDVLTEMYLSMAFFTTVLAAVVSVLLMLFLLFFNIDVIGFSISGYEGAFLARFIKVIWIPITVPLAVFFALYFYPSTEKDSIAKRIDKELPFATIHMRAISGSGISPVEIFKIISTSKEYPYLGKEIRKVMNQINLYGYDLVTALINVAKNTPSKKLSELFAGMTTNISSGGSLQTFFEKRAESLLTDYRLERERYTRVAETFMDIYITIVIAAPMILMLLLIMIFITRFQIDFTPQQVTVLLIVVISLINFLFLGLLQAKQPGY